MLMKGDVPILVGRDSADVWLSPHYFKMDFEAGTWDTLALIRFELLILFRMHVGAPPDMYAKDGQGWGFPPYNWDAMAKDEYWWWKGVCCRLCLNGFFFIVSLQSDFAMRLSSIICTALTTSLASIACGTSHAARAQSKAR